MYTSILIALAAAASAMPAPQVTAGSGPDATQEFALGVKIDNTFLSLTAVNNGTANERVLVAGRLAAYPGTPAFANVQDGGRYTSVNLDIDGESFGLVVTPVGNAYGKTTTILAKKNTQEFQWGISNGTIHHQTQAAFNFFYVCKDVVNGKEADVLKWGDANYDTTAPAGCVFTNLYQNCNVPGSQYKC